MGTFCQHGANELNSEPTDPDASDAGTDLLTAVSFNVNGIRAARRRGFDAWLAQRSPDVLALQELRCPPELVGELPGYTVSFDTGQIPGRNGVAIATRAAPVAVRSWATHPPRARGLAAFADHGRYIEVDLRDEPLTVACLYLPKGGLPAELQRPENSRDKPDGGAKHQRKMRFLAGFARELDRNRLAARRDGREFLLLGDLNIAHLQHDVTNWRPARKMEGFLPEEREWLDERLSPRRFVDVVRKLYGDRPGPLTWWSWAGESFAKDVGWRIDHQLATPGLAARARWIEVDKEPSADERLSDHAPLVVGYERKWRSVDR